jgi:DNA modification methylase
MEVGCISNPASTAFGAGAQAGLDWMPEPAGGTQHIPDPLVPDFTSRPFQVYCGDALEVIRALKAGGIQFDCVITSPPYFNQRAYGQSPREIGLEKNVDSFVRSLVSVFKGIPLRPWASVWVNIGNKRGKKGELLNIPSRFAIAMGEAGFSLLDEAIWVKEVVRVDGTSIGHCMVEPAPGRLNGNGWEILYRFVADPGKAWSDTCAVQIPRDPGHFFNKGTMDPIEQHPYSARMKCATSVVGRNLTNVWYVGNCRRGKNHYAAFPVELIERPVAMTCPEFLVDDGGEVKPRDRIVERTVYSEGSEKSILVYGRLWDWQRRHPQESDTDGERGASLEVLREKSGRHDSARHYTPRYPKSVGWTHDDRAAVGPGIVLDPFAGTGTTGEAAILLGRRFVGIELYEVYAERMSRRCEKAFLALRQSWESAAT